jgi:hypothetical protein
MGIFLRLHVCKRRSLLCFSSCKRGARICFNNSEKDTILEKTIDSNDIDEKAKKVQKSQLSDSVLQYIIRIIDYLIANRDHELTKCVCALYGDWNDALMVFGSPWMVDKRSYCVGSLWTQTDNRVLD